MRILKQIFGNLQARILSVFSLLLFVSFAIIAIMFNVALHGYISTGASDAINQYRAGIDVTYTAPTGFVANILGYNTQIFGHNIGHFSIANDFVINDADISPEALYITESLRRSNFILSHQRTQQIRFQYRVLHTTIVPGTNNISTVYYIDVTAIIRFSRSIMLMLIFLVTLIWLMTMFVANVIVGTLARPLKDLSNFAQQIGRGDFTPNEMKFTNEEFEELNQSLNYAARQLTVKENDQKTFFQNVSHELRTPLMSIKSYTEGIKYGIMEPAGASERILEATQRLTDMVGDILYISRLDNLAAPVMTMTNISLIADECIKHQQRVAENNGVRIVYHSDEHDIIIPCVAANIERAINNLISNAIRYAKSIITVECFTAGTRAIIRVSDDGPGFEPDALPYVFERFYSGKTGLSGIGLSMVKSIVDQHKGIATAENGAAYGAILTISVPKS